MKKIPLFIFIAILAILQLSVLGAFLGAQKIPNIILALAICLVIQKGSENYIRWIVIAGFLIDLGSSGLLGTSALLLVAFTFAVDKLNSVSNIQSRRLLFYPFFALVIAIFVFLFDWASLGIGSIENYIFSGRAALFPPIQLNADYFWKIALTILSGYAIHYILKKIQSNDSRKIFQQKTAS